jgi:hypothetical protein
MGLSRIVSSPVIDHSVLPRGVTTVGNPVWHVRRNVPTMNRWVIAALLHWKVTLMNDERARRQARQRAGAKLGFYIHLTVYVLVNLLLLAINLQTSPGRLWFLWSLCGWGVGILCHGVSVFLGPRIMQRMTERELKNEREKK